MALKNKLFSMILACASVMGISYAASPMIITPDQLKWQAIKGMPMGAEAVTLYGDPTKHEFFIAYIQLPPGYQVPVHAHPIVENDTILSGAYYLGVGKVANPNTTTELTPGSFVSIPKGTYHYGYTKDGTIIQITGIGPWGMIYQ